MKIRHSKTPLPIVWTGHPSVHDGDILLEKDLALSKHSRLRAKLLVFKNNLAMKRFFDEALDKPGQVTRKTLGIVSQLSCEVYRFKNKELVEQRLEVDPRYFCLIGLIVGHLSMEIICHESVHAGFAYAARSRVRQWVRREDDLDEEQVCYPAGRIASLINKAVWKARLYDQ